jgi:hypothetical protein
MAAAAYASRPVSREGEELRAALLAELPEGQRMDLYATREGVAPQLGALLSAAVRQRPALASVPALLRARTQQRLDELARALDAAPLAPPAVRGFAASKRACAEAVLAALPQT